MGLKDKSIVIFKSNSLMNESYFDSSGSFTGSSFRFGTDVLKSKIAKIDVKQMLNTDEKLKFSNLETRLTINSPELKIATNDKITFSGALENRTSLKLDEKFNKQDITNSIRPKLKLKMNDLPIVGELQAYSALKFDCTQKNPDIKFKGSLVGIQKNFGRISGWAEAHIPPEAICTPTKTTFAVGMGIKL